MKQSISALTRWVASGLAATVIAISPAHAKEPHCRYWDLDEDNWSDYRVCVYDKNKDGKPDYVSLLSFNYFSLPGSITKEMIDYEGDGKFDITIISEIIKQKPVDRAKVEEFIKDTQLKIKDGMLFKLKKLYGASKKKTTDEELHAIGEKAFDQLEKEFKLRKIELVDKILSKSQLTEKDALELGRKVNKVIAKRHKKHI